ncbi:BLUF domain-containing protein [Psychrobacter namhaensis]|uniref:BLUF domain-containing protein n=1 Tax=Psychrobacter namhaensis TaxID=292734 RepID=UPI0018E032AC|nr:BLUF domain-containing protein [Psychrobacter namhaensis]
MTNTTLEPHILVSMTYVSRANPDMSAEEFSAILQQAQANNTVNAITGMLIFNNNYFLQTIEGSRAQINHLLDALIADQRHYDLQLIETRELRCREWSRWAMNYASPTKENAALYLKYSTTVKFNPYLLSAESVRGLMSELSQ